MLNAARHRVVSLFRSLGSLLVGEPRAADGGARVVRPWREDALRTYPTVGLTPARVLSVLQAADGGRPQTQFELFDEMLQKWPRLAAVEATRRLALTGLDWRVAPRAAPDDSDAPLASSAARYCQETLDGVERLRDVLAHLATAIGHGVAVAELVWESGRLVDITPVPHSRLISDPHEPWRLRVRTEQEPTLGVALDEQPQKWIVHRPNARAGRCFDGGLLRASALLYVAQNLSFKDWLIYSQIAGMPVRVAQYEPGIADSDKRELLRMLKSLGADAAAAFSKSIDLKFIEASKAGDRPYQPLQEYCNTEITILWLGQHLTTDIRQSGSRAAAEVHDRVREDLLVDDINDESATIGRDVLRPLVRARFGEAAPIPVFRRSLVQSVDTKTLAETLAVAVNELGMAIPKRWLHEALGVPEPTADDAVVSKEKAQ